MTDMRAPAATAGTIARTPMTSALNVGDAAPGFELPDADMNMVTLEEFRDRRNVVLYFYPKDDTPGCTMEAIDFSELEEDFSRVGAVVLGVSMDDCVSHGAFRDKHGLSVQLLSDEDAEVCRSYGVMHDREIEGKHKIGILRSTFVVDKKGVVRHAAYGVNPRGHAAEMLEILKGMARCKSTATR
jgi:thioredoxin-dependent peroxiredoxin